jgi:hypothetical protein
MGPRFNHFLVLALLLSLTPNIRAASTQTTYNLHEQNSLQQTGTSSFVAGYPLLGVDQFSLVSAVDTGGTNLSAVPVLGLPTGNVTFPTGPNSSPIWMTGKGYNEYHWGDGWTSAAFLNSNDGSGNFSFTLGDATAMPTLSLDTASPTFPISPTVTGGGLWSGSHLLVPASVSVTLTFNTGSFPGYSNGQWLGAQIKFEFVDSNLEPIVNPAVSQNFPGLGKTDPALTSYTVSPGTLVAGQTYNLQANYTQYNVINTTSFTGTGISGTPVGLAGYLTTTFVTVDAIPFKISVVRSAVNIIHMQGRGMPNVVNRIESSPDLSPGSFTALTSVTADSTGAFQYDDTNAGVKKFYRLAYP